MSAAMAIDVGANNASRMLGPTIGGLVLATTGITGAFTISVVCYAVAVIAACRLRHRNSIAPVASGAVFAHVVEGLMMVRRDKHLVGVLTITVIYNVFGWPFTSMIPVIGQDSLHLDPSGIGLLASMDGIGAFISATMIALWARPPHLMAEWVGAPWATTISGVEGLVAMALSWRWWRQIGHTGAA
jgi:hypothetical protein